MSIVRIPRDTRPLPPVRVVERPQFRPGTPDSVQITFAEAWRRDLRGRVEAFATENRLPLGGVGVRLNFAKAEVMRLEVLRDHVRGEEIVGRISLNEIPANGSFWCVARDFDGELVVPVYAAEGVTFPPDLLPPFDLDALEREMEAQRARRRRRRKRGKRGGRNRQGTRRDAR